MCSYQGRWWWRWHNWIEMNRPLGKIVADVLRMFLPPNARCSIEEGLYLQLLRFSQLRGWESLHRWLWLTHIGCPSNAVSKIVFALEALLPILVVLLLLGKTTGKLAGPEHHLYNRTSFHYHFLLNRCSTNRFHNRTFCKDIVPDYLCYSRILVSINIFFTSHKHHLSLSAH